MKNNTKFFFIVLDFNLIRRSRGCQIFQQLINRYVNNETYFFNNVKNKFLHVFLISFKERIPDKIMKYAEFTIFFFFQTRWKAVNDFGLHNYSTFRNMNKRETSLRFCYNTRIIFWTTKKKNRFFLFFFLVFAIVTMHEYIIIKINELCKEVFSIQNTNLITWEDFHS